jgi:hypothetical protein
MRDARCQHARCEHVASRVHAHSRIRIALKQQACHAVVTAIMAAFDIMLYIYTLECLYEQFVYTCLAQDTLDSKKATPTITVHAPGRHCSQLPLSCTFLHKLPALSSFPPLLLHASEKIVKQLSTKHLYAGTTTI